MSTAGQSVSQKGREKQVLAWVFAYGETKGKLKERERERVEVRLLLTLLHTWYVFYVFSLGKEPHLPHNNKY